MLADNKMKNNLLSLMQSYQLCPSCGIVDQDGARTTVGHPCQRCNKASESGLMFFDLKSQMLIDLLFEAWTEAQRDPRNRRSQISIVIFYCTLQELLLDDLLQSCMWVAKVPQPLIEKTLADNKFISKRVKELFPALANKKFTEAIREALPNQSDSQKLLTTWEKAIELRNKFVHRGNQWGIPDGFSQVCWESVVLLFKAFVALHNAYAVKVLSANQPPQRTGAKGGRRRA